MRHLLRMLTVLLLAAVTCAAAEDVPPGDRVRLIEREQHIPAHPAPADTRVQLRFVSGSEATVLQVNAAHRLDRGARRAPAGEREHRLDYVPVPGQRPRRRGTRVELLGLVSPQRFTDAASEWPAAARHLEFGEPPCPR
jgi:hypothetical protein